MIAGNTAAGRRAAPSRLPFARASVWAMVGFLCALEGSAEIALPQLFSDQMVLQRGKPVPVWGTAAPGEKVMVRFSSQQREAAAGADGLWRVVLDPMPAGGPFTLSVAGRNALEVRDVMVGDVWICSGQSNMAGVMRYYGDTNELAGAELPGVRFVAVKESGAYSLKTDLRVEWQAVRGLNAMNFSAIAFYVGRELNAATGVAMGMVQAAIGNTSIMAWMNREEVQQDPRLKGLIAGWQKDLGAFKDYDADFEKYRAEWEKEDLRYVRETRPAWEEQVRRAAEKGEKPSPRPPRPGGPFTKGAPTAGYAAMIHPFTRLPVKGVIWYQGESDTGNSRDYGNLLACLIAQWRISWNDPNLPFVIVQLPRFRPPVAEPGPSPWASLREAQMKVSQSVSNCYLSVNTDLGDPEKIHPRPKQPFAHRIATVIRNSVYGEAVPSRGPTFKAMSVEGQRIRITFDDAEGGLVAKAEDSVKGFDIAGQDRRFFRAQGSIEGNAVLVESPKVSKPVAVRYAWADFPLGNLFNGAGLPASTFRTDDWEEGSGPSAPAGAAQEATPP